MGRDPDGFFKSAKERYGDIFGVQAAGQRQYYVTSSTHVNTIYKNSKSFVFAPTRLRMMIAIFGMSQDSVYNGWMVSSLFPVHHRLLSPAHVGPFVDAILLNAHRLLLEQRDAIHTDEHHTTLEAFTLKFMFKAIAAAFFGPLFPADEAYEPFLGFDSYFPLIAAEMPSFVTSKGLKARDALIRLIGRYLENSDWSSGAAEVMKGIVEECRAATPPLSTWDTAAYVTIQSTTENLG
ncbi:hypothetical protein FRB99_006096 [Tulasnella sp. 403]|nr:hypothetical protein FRB99_006096 [Tulasnella sp. 403]